MTDWNVIAYDAINIHKAQHVHKELVVFLTILDSMNPESVLEIGSADGGLMWAIMHIESIRNMVTVDLVRSHKYVSVFTTLGDRVGSIKGDSTAPDVVAAAEGMYDVVIIDGGHSGETPASDWSNYARMAKPGGLVMIHDTQGWRGANWFTVPELWDSIRKHLSVVELVSRPGVEAGTGLVWAGTGDWWNVL